jgi:hypothetical protein
MARITHQWIRASLDPARRAKLLLTPSRAFSDVEVVPYSLPAGRAMNHQLFENGFAIPAIQADRLSTNFWSQEFVQVCVGSALGACSSLANKTRPDWSGQKHFFGNGFVACVTPSASCNCDFSLLSWVRIDCYYSFFSEILFVFIVLVDSYESWGREIGIVVSLWMAFFSLAFSE